MNAYFVHISLFEKLISWNTERFKRLFDFEIINLRIKINILLRFLRLAFSKFSVFGIEMQAIRNKIYLENFRALLF